MQLNIIPLEHHHYDTVLEKWWKDWGWVPPKRDFLPNDGTGDNLREAFIKVNSNFDETFYSDAEIKAKYENNADTNAFTDLEKTNLSNQSGVNTGDETDASIKSKYENNPQRKALREHTNCMEREWL